VRWRTQHFDVAPQFTWLSARYGQSQASAQGIVGEGENQKFAAAPLLNCNFNYRFSNKISANLGFYNILNHSFVLIQAYYGNHAPMPAFDRQINAGLTVKL
jgi:TonB dependent receptor